MATKLVKKKAAPKPAPEQPMVQSVFPTPSVGRVVHYFPHPQPDMHPGPWAAIITDVTDLGLDLLVFPPRGQPATRLNVQPKGQPSPMLDHWAWPVR